MTIIQILVFCLLAWIIGVPVLRRWRIWTGLVLSIIALYWLQIALPIRNLDFWLPTISLGLTGIVWAATQRHHALDKTRLFREGLLICIVVVLIGLMRYLPPICCLTPTRPPAFEQLLIVGLSIAAIVFLIRKSTLAQNIELVVGGVILLLFVFQKSDLLTTTSSAWLRSLTGQNPDLASPVDIGWVGYSYLAFRLLHAIRDHQTGKLPAFTLGEFTCYVLFFPALTAGPIHRSEQFVPQLYQSGGAWQDDINAGMQRIFVGIFKKFVLADSLAIIAINHQNVTQVANPIWLWVLVYAYALRLYYDFSGYTDIAIGISRFVGVALPENFLGPYLKPNLTAFWNSWHITLAQWFRSYFFNPLTRALRNPSIKLPVWAIILTGQLGTMLLIGLWHGISLNFAIWGLWHGFGLFIHNRWTDWLKRRTSRPSYELASYPWIKLSGWFLTFNYVCLGWVWFVLPDTRLAWQTVLKLIGLSV